MFLHLATFQVFGTWPMSSCTILIFSFIEMAGQNYLQGEKLTGQLRILAGHCLLIGRYFAICHAP